MNVDLLLIESDHYMAVSFTWKRDAEMFRSCDMPATAKTCLRHHIVFREKARTLAKQAKAVTP